MKALKDGADEPIWADPGGAAGVAGLRVPDAMPSVRLNGPNRLSATGSIGSDLVLKPFGKPEDGGNGKAAALSEGQWSPGFQRRVGKMPATQSVNRGTAIKMSSIRKVEAGRVRVVSIYYP